jgi:hypothetical protein
MSKGIGVPRIHTDPIAESDAVIAVAGSSAHDRAPRVDPPPSLQTLKDRRNACLIIGMGYPKIFPESPGRPRYLIFRGARRPNPLTHGWFEKPRRFGLGSEKRVFDPFRTKAAGNCLIGSDSLVLLSHLRSRRAGAAGKIVE